MPFASAFSGTQKNYLRTNAYTSDFFLAYCPNNIVFQAQSAEAIASNVFAEFEWTNTTEGDYTDVKVGQTVFITIGTTLTAPRFIGRVRKVPTSDTFYINEAAIVLQSGYYVTVIDDYRLYEKLGRVATDGTIYTDWDVTYAAPAPVISGLQSAYVNSVSSGSASFSFAPTAYPNAHGASISSWSWNVEDGTITTGSSSTQNVTVSFPQGFRWVRVTATSSNGQSTFYTFPVWVGQDYVIPNVENLSVEASLSSGYNGSVSLYDISGSVFRSLLDETLVCAFSVENFGASSTPIVTNIELVGRTRQESGFTTGDEQYGELQSGSLTIEGIGTQLARLSSPQLALVDKASPAIWGEYVKPTPNRMIAHLATRHSTLANICCITFNTDNDAFITTYLRTETTSAGEAYNEVLNYINAKLNYAPSGEIRIERDAFFLTSSDKAALDTVMDFEYAQGDLLDFTIERDYAQTVGRVQMGAEVYNTTSRTSVIVVSSSPPTARGNGEQEIAVDGQILTADSDASAAATELAVRTGALYAVSLPKIILNARLFDAFRNTLIPTCFQWYTFLLPSTSNIRGLIYNTNQRWLLQSISQSLDLQDINGVSFYTRTIQAQFVLEPSPASAQNLSAIVPDLVETALPVIPTQPAYPGLPENPLINYPTDSPEIEDLQPISGGSNSPFIPLPADEAVQAGEEAGEPGCKTINVFFSNSSNTSTEFNLQSGEDYTISIRGDAQLGDDIWEHTFDFTVDDGGFVNTDVSAVTPGNQFTGEWTDGVGWTETAVNVNNPNRTSNGIGITKTFTSAVITEIQVAYSATLGTDTAPDTPYPVRILGADFDELGDSYGSDLTFTVNPPAVARTYFTLFSSVDIMSGHNQPTTGTATYTSITVRGTGTNPFTGSSGGIVRGDAFYHSYNPEAGGTPTPYTSQGFFIQDAQYTPIPPYSPSHVYDGLPYTGDGNLGEIRFAYSDYSGIENTFMIVTICGPGANT